MWTSRARSAGKGGYLPRACHSDADLPGSRGWQGRGVMTIFSNDVLFDLRWDRAEADLLAPLARLYGDRLDTTRLRRLLADKWAARPDDLKGLDLRRDLAPRWFLHQRMAGYVFYVDRSSRTLSRVLPPASPICRTWASPTPISCPASNRVPATAMAAMP